MDLTNGAEAKASFLGSCCGSDRNTMKAARAKHPGTTAAKQASKGMARAPQAPKRARPKAAKRSSESTTQEDRWHAALVLQGGAALGAYEAGVLLALLDPPARRVDIVTGCSIGALMAAIVVGSRGDPAEALRDMWRRFAMPINPFLPNFFARSLPLPGAGNVYRPNPVYFSVPMMATHMYEAEPLEQAIEEWVDFDKLNASATEVIVTAVEVKSGRLAEFSNRDGLTPKHIVASASLPPVFPVTSIGDGDYWDGGLIANTPLRPAINAIEHHNQVAQAPLWELIVVDLFEPSAQPPRDMTDVLQRAFELVFFGKFQHDLKLFQWMNAQLDLMLAVDRALPASSAVRRHPAYVKLKKHRRVDRLTVVRASDPQTLGGPADFSATAIDARIALGLADGRRALARAGPPARRGSRSAG
jgi:NTE family protein